MSYSSYMSYSPHFYASTLLHPVLFRPGFDSAADLLTVDGL